MPLPVLLLRLFGSADAVVQQIEELILNGVLRPGDRLPPERELASEIDISRPVLREALKLLEERGLLTSRQGGGTFVADAKEPRLLVPRQVDSPPPYYKVLPEGLIHDWDGSDNIRSAGTSDIDGGLQGDKNPRTWDGVDFNRQWVTNWDEGQNGSGDFPFSEIEMRHLITFIHSHPKIFGIMGCKIALLLLICAQAFMWDPRVLGP